VPFKHYLFILAYLSLYSNILYEYLQASPAYHPTHEIMDEICKRNAMIAINKLEKEPFL